MITKIKDLRDRVFGSGVKNGQIRTNRCGRVVMVITDVRMPNDNSGRTETIRALLLKEQENCNGGTGTPFVTIPKEYTFEEIKRQYPIVLEGELTFK